MKELFAEGTLHQKMRCWAPGMEGWKPLDQIAQLKWMLVATGTALINESQLAALILDMFIRICDSYPTRYGVWSCSAVARGVVLLLWGACSSWLCCIAGILIML